MARNASSIEAKLRGEEREVAIRREKRFIILPSDSVAKEQREVWRYDLVGFCQNVMRESFPLAFSPHHIDMLRKMEQMILRGGTQAIAMPRGSGKSTCVIAAALWAILYGHRRYGTILASDQGSAERLLQSVKTEIWLSPGVGVYWPRLRAYIEKGDGQAQKFRHILNPDGSQPLISWGKDFIKLPNVAVDDEDEWSGAAFQARGLGAGVRGMQYKAPDGGTIRPDFAIIDDPQTKEVANSHTQITDRESIIQGDVLGLAGPGKDMAVFMLMTVIAPNDLADRFLNPKLHPEWLGIRVPMIESFPDEIGGLWEEYRILYLNALTDGRKPDEARKFYADNREAMDKGGSVYWEDRKGPDDLSALEHAIGLRIRLQNEFLAEYQNQPLEYRGGKPYHIDSVTVMQRTNGFPRLHVPTEASLIVSFTDINHSGLNTVVMASTNDAVRYILDYQTYPGNGMPLYDSANFLKKKEGDQLAIARALDIHIKEIGAARYARGGKLVSPDLILIDCGNWMDLVFRWCETKRHTFPMSRLSPSRGRAASKYRPTGVIGKPGDGWHAAEWDKRGRVLVHNADEWRMRVQRAFLMPSGIPGGVTIFGDRPAVHSLYADEITSEVLEEYIEATEGGNTFFKWGKRVGVPNDKLDATTGCFVGLSFLGASESGLAPKKIIRKPQPKRPPIKIKI